MTEWFEAHAAPQSFEGRTVWQFSETTGQITIEMVPTHYSRTPGHSYGLWWAEMKEPKPPVPITISDESDDVKTFPPWRSSEETIRMTKEIAVQLSVTPKWVVKTAIDRFAKHVETFTVEKLFSKPKKVQCPRCWGNGKAHSMDKSCYTCDGVGMIDEWRDH